MEITDLYSKIEGYALNTKTVESYKTGDPYVVLNSLHIHYPIVMSQLNYVRYEDEVMVANISLYYAGKQLNDSSNIYDLQDTGFKVIYNILKHLVNDYELQAVESIQLNPFSQRFADICAGAYADINVYIPNDEICLEFDK